MYMRDGKTVIFALLCFGIVSKALASEEICAAIDLDYLDEEQDLLEEEELAEGDSTWIVQCEANDTACFQDKFAFLTNIEWYPDHLYTDLDSIFEDWKEIGTGGQGVIYVGKPYDSEEKIVVKCPIVTNPDYVNAEVAFLSSFTHPNIVGFKGTYMVQRWDDEEEEYDFCYGMEFVDGGSVANLIRDTAFCKTGHHCVYYRLTHLKEPTIAYITYEILQVLHFLHEKGLFNRDLKGPNVMLTKRGEVKMVDFSHVDLETVGQTDTVFPGSAHWQAPEVIQKQPYGKEVDIWALGIMVKEMAEGFPDYYHAWHDETQKLILEKGITGFLEPEKWSPEMHDFFHQCTKWDPKERPTTAQLLEHPFFNKRGNAAELSKLVTKNQELRKKRKRRMRAD